MRVVSIFSILNILSGGCRNADLMAWDQSVKIESTKPGNKSFLFLENSTLKLDSIFKSSLDSFKCCSVHFMVGSLSKGSVRPLFSSQKCTLCAFRELLLRDSDSSAEHFHTASAFFLELIIAMSKSC